MDSDRTIEVFIPAFWPELGRHSARREREVVEPLTPRLLVDDVVSLKEAAIAALVALLPGYVCRDEVRAGALRQVLPG